MDHLDRKLILANNLVGLDDGNRAAHARTHRPRLPGTGTSPMASTSDRRYVPRPMVTIPQFRTNSRPRSFKVKSCIVPPGKAPGLARPRLRLGGAQDWGECPACPKPPAWLRAGPGRNRNLLAVRRLTDYRSAGYFTQWPRPHPLPTWPAGAGGRCATSRVLTGSSMRPVNLSPLTLWQRARMVGHRRPVGFRRTHRPIPRAFVAARRRALLRQPQQPLWPFGLSRGGGRGPFPSPSFGDHPTLPASVSACLLTGAPRVR